jgi:hypothetical protein
LRHISAVKDDSKQHTSSASSSFSAIVILKGKRKRDLLRKRVMVNHKAVTVSMGFEDLSTVVNGKQGDLLENRPFDRNFTKAKICASWVKVGFVPFTRNCVKHKKVRHERGQRKKDVSLEKVHNEYEFPGRGCNAAWTERWSL